MDIWGQIYIGKRWVEDDGSQSCEIQNSKEWHVKTAHKIRVEPTGAFKVQFAQLGMECAKIIAMQLEQMRDELLYLAEHGIHAKEAKGEKKKAEDTGAE
jgi:hypothetical protein